MSTGRTAVKIENLNLFSIGEGFGFFVFFGNENNGSSLTTVCPKPYQKKNHKEGTQTVTFGEASEVASEGNGSDLDCIPAPRKTRTHLCSGFSFSVRKRT